MTAPVLGPRRAAVYLRVSTATKSRRGEVIAFEQDPALQERPLRDLIAQRGWTVYRVYSDRLSGAKEARPALNALMADARRGLFDIVLVWRFDRLARSVKQLVLALEEFRALQIDFVSHQEALDTSTPMGKAMFTIIGARAELERSIIRERVVAGLDYARQHGTRSGRAVGRPRKIFPHDRIPELLAEGLSPREIARKIGIGEGTVRQSHAHADDARSAAPKPYSGDFIAVAMLDPHPLKEFMPTMGVPSRRAAAQHHPREKGKSDTQVRLDRHFCLNHKPPKHF